MLRYLSEHDKERLAYAKQQVETSKLRWKQSSALLSQVLRDLHASGARTLDLANEIGVSKQRLSQICATKEWVVAETDV